MAISQQNGNCCPNHFGGFCLDDGTPIIVVTENNAQLGWINILTGVFTPGAVPAGTVVCSEDISPLDCLTDSVTVCPGEDPLVVVAADLDIRPLTCETDSVTVCQPEVTATFSSVAASLTNVTLLAANPNRKRAILFMDGTSTAFVKFGAVASTTSFSIKIPTQTYYELTFGYVGVIDAIWSGTINGSVRITEFV